MQIIRGTFLLALACLAGLAQTPQEAWAQLREHGAAVTELYMKHDGTFQQLGQVMGFAGTQFAGDKQKLMDLRNLIALRHRTAVYTMWGADGGASVANALRVSRDDFRNLNNMKPRFLQLANQMATARTPQSEKEFLSYLNAFAGTVKRLDDGQFSYIYSKMAEFAADCPLHADTVARLDNPTRNAVDAYTNSLRASERNGMNDLKNKRNALFQFLGTWDANQGRYLAAANVVMNDWRRIHNDTAGLAAFLSSPTFVKDLPDIDASNAMDTLDRIGGYLDTYR